MPLLRNGCPNERRAFASAENQAALVDDRVRPISLQGGFHEARHGNNPDASLGLWRLDRVDLIEGLRDVDSTVAEVGPAQAKDFAQPQAAEGRQIDHCAH